MACEELKQKRPSVRQQLEHLKNVRKDDFKTCILRIQEAVKRTKADCENEFKGKELDFNTVKLRLSDEISHLESQLAVSQNEEVTLREKLEQQETEHIAEKKIGQGTHESRVSSLMQLIKDRDLQLSKLQLEKDQTVKDKESIIDQQRKELRQKQIAQADLEKRLRAAEVDREVVAALQSQNEQLRQQLHIAESKQTQCERKISELELANQQLAERNDALKVTLDKTSVIVDQQCNDLDKKSKRIQYLESKLLEKEKRTSSEVTASELQPTATAQQCSLVSNAVVPDGSGLPRFVAATVSSHSLGAANSNVSRSPEVITLSDDDEFVEDVISALSAPQPVVQPQGIVGMDRSPQQVSQESSLIADDQASSNNSPEIIDAYTPSINLSASDDDSGSISLRARDGRSSSQRNESRSAGQNAREGRKRRSSADRCDNVVPESDHRRQSSSSRSRSKRDDAPSSKRSRPSSKFSHRDPSYRSDSSLRRDVPTFHTVGLPNRSDLSRNNEGRERRASSRRDARDVRPSSRLDLHPHIQGFQIKSGSSFNNELQKQFSDLVCAAYVSSGHSVSALAACINDGIRGTEHLKSWQIALSQHASLSFSLCCGGQKRMIQFFLRGLHGTFHVVCFQPSGCLRSPGTHVLRWLPNLDAVKIIEQCSNAHFAQYRTNRLHSQSHQLAFDITNKFSHLQRMKDGDKFFHCFTAVGNKGDCDVPRNVPPIFELSHDVSGFMSLQLVHF